MPGNGWNAHLEERESSLPPALGANGAVLILMPSALSPSGPFARTGPPPVTSIHRTLGHLGILKKPQLLLFHSC